MPTIESDSTSSMSPALSNAGTATTSTTENATAELLDESGSGVAEDAVASKPNRKFGRMSPIDTTTSKEAAAPGESDDIVQEIGPRLPTAGVVHEAEGPDVCVADTNGSDA